VEIYLIVILIKFPRLAIELPENFNQFSYFYFFIPPYAYNFHKLGRKCLYVINLLILHSCGYQAEAIHIK
jgi:hypothetical protein